MTFVQIYKLVAGTNGVSHYVVTCYGYQSKGHYRDKCPSGDHVQLLHHYVNIQVVPTETAKPYI